jgi:hypothetical protein
MGLVQRWRGLRRYRCRECRRTFYSQLSPAERESSSMRFARRMRQRPARQPNPYHRNRLRRRATELLLFLCLVVIFYAAIRYLARVP